ncbi:response regulator transcription factor LtdR [Cyclobacterium sediminis]
MAKLLIVEDNPRQGADLVSSINELFYNNEFEILGPVFSFDTAKATLLKSKPDLAILDVHLQNEPEGGLKIGKQINSTTRIPLVYLTGLPDDKWFYKAMTTDPIAFLKKPYDSEALKRTLLYANCQRMRNNNFQAPLIRANCDDFIFVKTGRNQFKKLKLNTLIYLMVDDHYIHANHLDVETPIMFSQNGGLEGFFTHYLDLLENRFFRLNRKYLINLKFIESIINNHVVLPRPVPDWTKSKEFEMKYFTISISDNSKVELEKRLRLS